MLLVRMLGLSVSVQSRIPSFFAFIVRRMFIWASRQEEADIPKRVTASVTVSCCNVCVESRKTGGIQKDSSSYCYFFSQGIQTVPECVYMCFLGCPLMIILLVSTADKRE